MLKGKIHRATVIQAELDYVGSITVDEELLEAAGILEYEKVQIVDVNNGSRFETYTICGERGSGMICLNGAAARCVSTGDKIIIMAYGQYDPEEAKNHKPSVVFVDEKNRFRLRVPLISTSSPDMDAESCSICGCRWKRHSLVMPSASIRCENGIIPVTSAKGCSSSAVIYRTEISMAPSILMPCSVFAISSTLTSPRQWQICSRRGLFSEIRIRSEIPLFA